MFDIKQTASTTGNQITLGNLLLALLGCIAFISCFIGLMYLSELSEDKEIDEVLQIHIEGIVTRKYIYGHNRGKKPQVLVWLSSDKQKHKTDIGLTNANIYDKIIVGDSIYSESGSDTFTIIRHDTIFKMQRMIYKRR